MVKSPLIDNVTQLLMSFNYSKYAHFIVASVLMSVSIIDY